MLDGLTESGRATLRALGLPGLAARLGVCWNPRLTTTAGRAFHRPARIELNPRLIGHGDDELRRTFLHELAHLVAIERAGRRRIPPHGPEWRAACADLGIPGDSATHSLPWPRRTLTRRHHYVCPNCLVIVRRARRIRRATACAGCCRRLAKGRYDPRFRLVEI